HWEHAEHDLQGGRREILPVEADEEIVQESLPISLSPFLARNADEAIVPHLEIQAFGEPMVLLDGKPVTRWRMARGMELCFYLLECKHPMRKEQLISALWEEVDEQTSQTFYSTVH